MTTSGAWCAVMIPVTLVWNVSLDITSSLEYALVSRMTTTLTLTLKQTLMRFMTRTLTLQQTLMRFMTRFMTRTLTLKRTLTALSDGWHPVVVGFRQNLFVNEYQNNSLNVFLC